MQIGNGQVEYARASYGSALLPLLPTTIGLRDASLAHKRGRIVGMIGKGEANALRLLDPNEKALLEKEGSENQPVLTLGLLIFSLAFCALVFQAGLKERLAHEKCGALAGCSASIVSPSAATLSGTPIP